MFDRQIKALPGLPKKERSHQVAKALKLSGYEAPYTTAVFKKWTKFSLRLERNDIPQKEGRGKAIKSTQQTVWT